MMRSRLRGVWTELPPVLRGFCAGSIALTLVGLMTVWVCRHLLHLTDYPYGYYIVPHPGDDLLMFYERFRYFHSMAFFSPETGAPWEYPAAIAPIYWLLYRTHHGLYSFLLAGPVLLLALAVLFVRSLRRHGLSTLTAAAFTGVSLLFSYAFYFEFHRGNVELFLWMMSGLAVWLVMRGRTWQAAALIGIAGAMKLYPLVYVGLLIARKRYREAVFAVICAGLMTVISLWLICPDLGYSWRSVQSGVHLFSTLYVARYCPIFIGLDHSLFALLKRLLPVFPAETYRRLLPLYMGIVGTGGVVLFFTRIRKMPFANQVLCLAVASILLPPLSFDYTLQHLYTPFALLVVLAVDRYRGGRERTPGLAAVFLCFTLLLSQTGEVILHGDRLGGQIKSVVLCAAFVIGLIYPFRNAAEEAHLAQK